MTDLERLKAKRDAAHTAALAAHTAVRDARDAALEAAHTAALAAHTAVRDAYNAALAALEAQEKEQDA